MKKVRIFVATTAVLLTVGGVFAFKDHTKYGTGNAYFFNEENQCVVDPDCSITTSGGLQCTGTHYTAAGCATKATNDEIVD